MESHCGCAVPCAEVGPSPLAGVHKGFLCLAQAQLSVLHDKMAMGQNTGNANHMEKELGMMKEDEERLF